MAQNTQTPNWQRAQLGLTLLVANAHSQMKAVFAALFLHDLEITSLIGSFES